MPIRELTWQINMLLPGLRIFSLKTYEIPGFDLSTKAVSYRQGHKVFPLRGQSP